MSTSIVTLASFNLTKIKPINSNQRFYNPEEFKPSQLKRFNKKFLVVCSSVYANENTQSKLSTKEIRQRFQQGSFEIPCFDEWFRQKCFVVWDKEAKKLILKNDSGLLTQEELEKSQKILTDITMIEGPLETNFEEGSKTPIYPEGWTISNEFAKNLNEEKSIEMLFPKPDYNKRPLKKRTALKNRDENLAKKFKDITKSNIEDASFEVENVIGHRSINDKLELKIQWASDHKRKVQYKPTYESASLCSCSTAIREYSAKIHKKYQKIKRRPYFEKKFDVSKASNEALELALISRRTEGMIQVLPYTTISQFLQQQNLPNRAQKSE
ncbi:hypothetical protein BpHYR1_032085 [Brachionus plicatilis]|uniref:Uncharacterized protein n=1 Tax=Brachionus plicatilis TaxID=10195 RepID=A0A3M7T0G5_BRAPC|nr:hypothetical protein BpHYR1_032085 [Brachionus plicatilis]